MSEADRLLIVLIAATLSTCRSPTPEDRNSPLQRLVQAAPRSHRRVEARFSGGFPWAKPLRTPPQSQKEDEWPLQGVAGQVLSESERKPSIPALEAAGVARTMLGSADEGVSRLRRVCRLAPASPAAWNDLAAAIYARADDENSPSRLPSALSAADRALSLSPSLTEARFNRALILTRMGMRNEARRAWRAAVAAEPDRAWAAEAMRRLGLLDSETSKSVAMPLENALQAADSGDLQPLRAIVRRHPQEVRVAAETKMLTGWADAAANARSAEAAQMLLRVGRLGELLAETNGDCLLSDIVRPIATASPEARIRVARVQLAYRDARAHYARNMPHCAEELARIARRFAREHSPMEHVARYYSANAALDSNRPEQSRAALARVLTSIDPARYASLAAGAEKELAKYYGFRGMWTAALMHLERSRILFARLRESANAAFIGSIQGEAWDRLGDFERGWRYRAAALDTLTRGAPDAQSLTVLIAAVHAEIMRADYESALALIRVARRQADHLRIHDLSAELFLREARVLLIARGERASEQALARAENAAAGVANEAARARLNAEIAVEAAAIARPSDPRRAVDLVTPSIAFFQSHELGILLPPAYLERGRANLALGAFAEAREDFTSGLDWIERQRASVGTAIRTTLFDTVPDLDGELVDLLLTGPAADEREAYAVVERARARTLVEALGIAKSPGRADVESVMAALPPHAVLVEYALLRDDVAAFCITSGGLEVRRLAVKPVELRRAVTELRNRIEDHGPFSEAAANVYDQLLRPIEPIIGTAGILYIAPDRFLNAIPFAALYDSHEHRFLVQKRRLILTPSGTFFCRRVTLSRRIRPALIVADPTSPAGGRRLDSARRDATEIAAVLSAKPPLVGPSATVERFAAAAPRSALIVYAGHARSDETSGGFLPLAPSRGGDGRMDATAISRLPLRHTNLVVLYACATMRGDPSRIEGMPSISRAFLNAGAPAVIGTLWEIDERPASRLLAPFFQSLSGHMSPSEALREAQIRMITNGRAELRDPAVWAAAEILGVD